MATEAPPAPAAPERSAEVKKLVMTARLEEQADRFEDMVTTMTTLVNKVDNGLLVDERNLLSVAYKNVIGHRRASIRAVSSVIARPNTTPRQKELGRELLAKILEEFDLHANAMLDLLDKKLLPRASTVESRVFFLKMKGDYYRYKAEAQRIFHAEDPIMSKEKAGPLIELADNSYTQGVALAKGTDGLTPVDPIRLGLNLNYSVFLCEIKEDVDLACSIAKDAFDEAITALDSTPDEQYKDSTLIMQLLRDNLTLWTTELPQEKKKESDEKEAKEKEKEKKDTEEVDEKKKEEEEKKDKKEEEEAKKAD